MALLPIQQNQSTYPITFGPIILSSDHISSATGKTVTVVISKNGGAFASPSGAVSEVGNGIYQIAANATDSNTLGTLQVYVTATGCDPYNDSGQVVAYNPYASTNLGLSALPSANPTALNGLPTVGTGGGQIKPDGFGNVYIGGFLQTAITGTASQIAASFSTFWNVATGRATAASYNQGADNNVILSNGTYGNAALQTIVSACQTILNKFGFDSNNNVNSSLAAILGTALTETTGYLAAAFKKFFNIAVPTLTTGDINQTGDSYAVVNNGTYGNAALQTAIANITNFTSLAVMYGPTTMVRPETSTETYLFTMVVKNETGALVALDASPTITIKNTAGTDRSANLGAITNPQTGVYQVIYTCTYTDANEDLQMIASGAVATAPRIAFANSVVADAESNSALATILAQVNKMTFTVPNRIDATTTLDVAVADVTSDASARATGVSMIRALFNRFFNQVTQTATTQIVTNDAGSTVSTMATSDNGTTATKGKSS